MKSSLNIYRKDLRNMITNWVAALLIGGIIILPSLYAWFNITASWDPYGNTDQIPVGIVNEDTGATVENKSIHVGDELVKNLKKNDSMKWHFDSREEAMDKVEYGDYFAVIVIPENFSERLATVVSGHPQKANIEYYVNEKINAVAPKITDKGATVIVDNITSNFVSIVNGVIFEKFNELGIQLEEDLPDIKRFEEYVFKLEENLPQIHEMVNESYHDAKRAQKIIDEAQTFIPRAQKAASSGLGTINETTKFLTRAEQRLNELSPQVKEDLQRAQTVAQDVNGFINDIQSAEIEISSGEQIHQQINVKTEQALARIETSKELLQQLKDSNNTGQADNETIDKAISRLDELQTSLEQIKSDAGRIQPFLEKKQQEVDQVLNQLNSLSGETATNIDRFLTEYNENIEPAVLKKVNDAQQTLANGKDILTDIQATIPKVENMLGRTEGNLQDGEQILSYMLNEYPYVNAKVNDLADRIRTIQGETDINEIIELLKNDPAQERGFFAEPVTLNKNEIFPVANYGIGMTPFYSVLAIWVGALLLISLLKVDVSDPLGYSVKQRYYGKLLTFLTINHLQTLIITSGDLLLIDVPIVHPIWFVVFGLITSLVFTVIVYTLVSLLGDIGKAIAIVFLVLQIAGSGGTYPVVLLPTFFQVINPFLPFTYAIDLMREAVAGIVWARVYRDLLALAAFCVFFLVIGTLLKKPINQKTDQLMKKSRESGLFH